MEKKNETRFKRIRKGRISSFFDSGTNDNSDGNRDVLRGIGVCGHCKTVTNEFPSQGAIYCKVAKKKVTALETGCKFYKCEYDKL